MEKVKKILTTSDYLFTLIIEAISKDYSINDYTIDKAYVKIGDNTIKHEELSLGESAEESQESTSNKTKSFIVNIPANTFRSTGYMYIKVFMHQNNSLFSDDGEENLSTQWIKTNVYYKKG